MPVQVISVPSLSLIPEQGYTGLLLPMSKLAVGFTSLVTASLGQITFIFIAG